MDNLENKRECFIHIPDMEPWHIEFEDSELGVIKFQGSDLFACLSNLRLYLEKKNFLLLCNGARIDVYPSSMTREMSAGRLAYVIKLGQTASRDDIVDIFETTSKENIGTVKQQKEYHTRWADSIRKH